MSHLWPRKDGRPTVEQRNQPHSSLFSFHVLQTKYKEDGKKNLCQSFYSQLPETSETRFAKTVSELQNEVRDTKPSVLFKSDICNQVQKMSSARPVGVVSLWYGTDLFLSTSLRTQ